MVAVTPRAAVKLSRWRRRTRPRDALYAAVLEAPDDVPRLVLSDWLEEHGDAADGALAEFIRLQSRLSSQERVGGLSEDELVAALPPEMCQVLWRPLTDEGSSDKQACEQWLDSIEDGQGGVSMTHDDAFLEAIVEAPEDATPRLVYADWLEERGDPRGEFIRIEHELEQLPPRAPRRHTLRIRERELLAEQQDCWLGPLRPLLNEWKFRRGFVEEATLPAPTFLDHAGELFRLAPLKCVRLTGVREHVKTLAALPDLARLATLDLRCNELDDDALRVLVASPHLGRIPCLNLMYNIIRDKGAQTLAAAGTLGRVAQLRVGGNPILRTGRESLVARFGERVSFGLEREEDYLYPIGADYYWWHTGLTRGFVQVLVVRAHEHAASALFFDLDGDLVDIQGKDFQMPEDGTGRWRDAWDKAVTCWLAEMAFSPETIWVKKFAHPTENVYLSDLPYCADDLLDPDALDEEEREGHFEYLRTFWEPERQFIFECADTHWMNGKGEVVAT